ncbi:hypothetical protein ACIO3S_28380 [Nocardioides sp. NPDC087217]|uniref:hypothetical protein n=1 Tax=Nocardioides sp. NPDC087217 TaxID=3364335 RepID=UPI00380ECFED
MAVSSGAKKTLISVAVLVAACALIVGIAHWRAHDLVAGDVAWHVEISDGGDEAVVVRDRIYTYEDDVLTIRELSSGREIAEDYLDGTWARVGDSGDVAVVSIDGLAMYDRSGDQVWHQTLDDLHMPIAISTDGELDAVRCAEDEGCTLVHFDAAGTITSSTSRESLDLGIPAVVGVTTLDDSRLVQRVPTVPVDIDPETRSAFQVRNGKRWGAPVAVMDDHVAAQVGDLLVGMSRKDGTCTFSAVRAGVRAWTTSTPCPDLGFPIVDVFANRIYVTNLSGRAYDVVTADLEGRRASAFQVEVDPASESDDRQLLKPAPDAVVLIQSDRIAAFSPTGKRLWSQDLDRRSRGSVDESKRLYPGVAVSGPIIDRFENGPDGVAGLAIGRKLPAYTHTFVDSGSGEETARLAAPYGSVPYGLDDGRVLMLGNDDMWLVSP